MPDLIIQNLHASVDNKPVLQGVNLTVRQGEIHALMGPNGSGKTTLSQVIMGHPKYQVTAGSIEFNGQDILKLTPDKRALLGMFLAFQYPKEIPGIKLFTFLRTIYNTKTKQRLTIKQFQQVLDEKLNLVRLEKSFLERYLNAGFSGGEKKKVEMLQLALLQPDLAVLDETDSGLDIDALRTVCSSLKTIKATHNLGVLLITHYNRILDYIVPDYVHVMIDGKIVQSGDKNFAKEVEEKGYDWLRDLTPNPSPSEGEGSKGRGQ